ncbi:hypothetical protein N7540_010418 [Penicillium herquei]|nr:hypothetical protein N7540_010418 [Penicillium herquei]
MPRQHMCIIGLLYNQEGGPLNNQQDPAHNKREEDHARRQRSRSPDAQAARGDIRERTPNVHPRDNQHADQPALPPSPEQEPAKTGDTVQDRANWLAWTGRLNQLEYDQHQAAAIPLPKGDDEFLDVMMTAGNAVEEEC